jgi:hypothetical protein
MPTINFTKTQKYDEYMSTVKQIQHQHQQQGQLLGETKLQLSYSD